MEVAIIAVVVALAIGIISWFFSLGNKAKKSSSNNEYKYVAIISQLRERNQELVSERNELELQLRSAEGRIRAAEAKLEAEQKNVLEQKHILEKAEEKLKDTFTALAGNALTKVNKQFLDIAEERFESKRKDVDKTIQPLAEAIKEYREQTGALKT
ncbi:hypothetical protein K8R78_06030, partial [bacterium]|nr:hypothetical protein [bacterium]